MRVETNGRFVFLPDLDQNDGWTLVPILSFDAWVGLAYEWRSPMWMHLQGIRLGRVAAVATGEPERLSVSTNILLIIFFF